MEDELGMEDVLDRVSGMKQNHRAKWPNGASGKLKERAS